MSEFFYVILEDISGNRLGNGPITTASDWTSTERLSATGSFNFRMAATDSLFPLLAEKLFIRCMVITNTGPQQVFIGIIDKISNSFDSDGNVVVTVSGSDTTRELTYRSVLFTELASGENGISFSVACDTLRLLAPPGWTIAGNEVPPNNDIYYKFKGETVLQSFIKLADLAGFEWRLTQTKELSFTNTWTESGLRAIEVPEEPDISNQATCYITSLNISCETFDIVSRIYPYGSDITTTLANTTRSAPTGYSIDKNSNFISNNNTETTYGVIEKVKHYRDIEKIGETAGHVISASNALYDLAINDLKIDSQITTIYDLSLSACTVVLKPMETIDCVFRRNVEGRKIFNVNQTLNIIETTNNIDAQGFRTTRIKVSDVQKRVPSELFPLVKLVIDNKLRV